MIYTVTLMDEFKDDWTAGYFTNLDDTINAVKNNELDVFEHCYNYAVIEAFDEGFHPMPEMKQMWFRYDKQTDRAYEIEPPVYNKIYKYAF